MPPGSTYRMLTPEGVTVDVPVDQVEYAKSRGYDFETGVDMGQRLPVEAAAKAADDRGFLGSAAAFTTGALRGATFGVSDAILPDLGVERDTLRDLKSQHGTASTLGEVTGAVAPALLSGGSSTVGTLARFTPAGAASQAAARIAAPGGIVRLAASGAAEGAAQNVGAYLSDVALGDRALTAEGFVGAGAEGAAWGGALGGGLGVAEKSFVKARDLLPKLRGGSKEEVLRAAEDLDVELQKAMTAGDDAVKSARDQLELMRLQRAELDVQAQQLVVEKRAADAAAAQSRAAAAEQRRIAQEARANAPRGRKGAPKPADAAEAAGEAAVETAAESVVDSFTAEAPAVAPAIADDVAGAPIGNVPPGAGGDLESLLAQSVQRVQGGATMADLAAESKLIGKADDVAGSPAALDDPTYGRRVEPIPGFESTTRPVTDAPTHTPGTIPPGWEWTPRTVEGQDVTRIHEALPSFDDVAAHAAEKTTVTSRTGREFKRPVDPVYVIHPSQLLGKEVYGSGAVRAGNIDAMAAAVRNGENLPVVPVLVTKDGKYIIPDGNHRVHLAAREDRPFLARFRQTVEEPTPSEFLLEPTIRAELGDRAASARASALDEIHEAMAELDPDAARLVQAVKAQEAAAEVLNRRFRVRAPQQVGGLEAKAIADAPNLTLGRVKTMYEKANDAERVALLQQIGPEKSKALLEIVEGKAGFAKWYKNKAHWWDDPSYRPLPSKATPGPDDLAGLTPRVAPGVEVVSPAADDVARMSAEELDVLDDMNRAISEISEYERTVNELATVLGPSAPPTAMEAAGRFGAAADDHMRRQVDRMAQIADDSPIPAPVLAQGSGPVPALDTPPAPAAPPVPAPVPAVPRASDAIADQMARETATRDAVKTVSLPGAPAKPAKRGGLLGTIADLGAANEALQAVGVNLPVPDVESIPLLGPVLGAYFKLRAGATVLSKAGFRVPFSGEAKVARGAAQTRDRIAAAVDRLMDLSARGTRAARPVVAVQAWRTPDALKAVLFDDEQPKRRKSSQEPAELVKRRVEELRAYEQNPNALRPMVRKQLAGVRDPDVIAAVVDVKQRQLDYLAKHAPTMPPPNSLVKSEWRISPAEVERFARRVRAANDPASVLEDVATGRVTPEAAETLREVYPRLYAEAQQRLIEQAPKLRSSLPHPTLVRLSMLFDAALAPSLEPERMAQIQAIGAPVDAPPPPVPSSTMQPPPAGAPDLSTFYATPGEQRAAR